MSEREETLSLQEKTKGAKIASIQGKIKEARRNMGIADLLVLLGVIDRSYGSFVEMLDGKWIKPKYQKIEHEIFIPLPKEVDQFIASCSPMMNTYLQLLS